VPPRVHADHDVGVGRPDGGGEIGRTVDLLGRVDLGARCGRHSADVDDVGALRDHRVDPAHRGVLVPGGAPIEEGIRGAGDEGYQDAFRRREAPPTQAQRTRSAAEPYGGRLVHDPYRELSTLAAGGRWTTGTGRSTGCGHTDSPGWNCTSSAASGPGGWRR